MIYRIIKFMLDYIFALILLPFLLLFLIFVGLAIKIEDRGKIFYKSNRIGKKGKIFKMYKFRTMVENAPDIRLEDGSTYNSSNDVRVTRVGKFLRKTSIDELPQIINILKGQMSFIGPRPDSAFWLENYTEEERIILKVRPGITGWNQAKNRNAVLTKEKIANDIYYVKNLSFWFDVKIFFLTIKTVLFSKNVNRDETNEENTNIRE